MSEICTTCGACCASFRVSFYWAETDAHPAGQVPAHLTIPITPHHVAMRGTDQHPVRCIALAGTPGESVGCQIYPLRSSTCRDFAAGEPACQQARAAHGLPPLTAEPKPVAAAAGRAD